MSQALIASQLFRRSLAQKGLNGFGFYAQSMGFATGGKVKEILSMNDWEQLVKDSEAQNRPICSYFTAVWCPPCKMIAPVYAELAAKHTDVDFVKIDIDNGAVANLVADNNVAAVPTFVSLKGKQKLMAFSGADKQQLLRMVQEVSNVS